MVRSRSRQGPSVAYSAGGTGATVTPVVPASTRRGSAAGSLLSERLGHFFRGHRSGEKISLRHGASESEESERLIDLLDALGHDPHTKGVAQVDHGPHRRLAVLLGQPVDERLVDLDDVQRESRSAGASEE